MVVRSSLSQEEFQTGLDIYLVEMLQIWLQDSMEIEIDTLKSPPNFEILRMGLFTITLQDILCRISHEAFLHVNFSGNFFKNIPSLSLNTYQIN